MKYLLLLLISTGAFAGFDELPSERRYDLPRKGGLQKKILKKKKVRSRSNHEVRNLLKKLEDQDLAISKLLEKNQKKVIVRRVDEKIRSLSRMKGQLLNSILAFSTRPTTFLIKIEENDQLMSGGELRCYGIGQEKRVPSSCDLLVTDDGEYKVDIKLWDLDGAEGMIADYYYTGEEKAFLASSFASFFQGVADAAKDRIVTPFGEATRSNAKNKVLNGLLGIATNAQRKIGESEDQNISISYVNAGKEVIVFFNSSLDFKEEK